jgi:hypothetical protein
MLPPGSPAEALAGQILAADLAARGRAFCVMRQQPHLGMPKFGNDPNIQTGVSQRPKFGSASQGQYPNAPLVPGTRKLDC